MAHTTSARPACAEPPEDGQSLPAVPDDDWRKATDGKFWPAGYLQPDTSTSTRS